MKVLMLMHSHALGGIEAHTLALMKGLADRGHGIVYAGPLDGWLGEQAAAAGLARVHIPMHGMFDVCSAWKLTRAARRVGADLIHGHASRGAHYAGWAARWAGIPSVATAHSTSARKHFGRARRLIAVSDAVADFLRHSGYDAARVKTIRLGIADPYERAVSARLRMREQLGLAADEVALGMVARFIRAKGHDLALDAVSALPDLRLRLFFVGDADTDWGRTMRRRVREQELAPRVRFLGERSDVPELLSAFDIVLGPSRREALSLTLIEASAMAKAVVASDIGGIPEVIDRDRTGLLVPIYNADMLTREIERLVRNPALREQLGIAARKHFLQHFGVETMIDKVAEVYAQTLAEHRGATHGQRTP